MIDEMLAFINGNPIKTLDVQISEQTTAIEGSIDTMQSGLQSKIDDMSNYLAEYLLESSDEVYLESAISYSWKNNGNVDMDIPEKIIFNTSGDAKLSYGFYCTSSGSESSSAATLKIYRNGSLLTQVYYVTSSTARTINLTGIKKGDVISFHVKTTLYYTSTTAYFNAVNVLATPIYARTLNLIEVEG